MNDMNESNSTSSATLDDQLMQLTEWTADGEPQAWRNALNIAKNRHGTSGGIGVRLLSWPIPRSLAAVLVLALIGLLLALMFLPTHGRERITAMAQMMPAPATTDAERRRAGQVTDTDRLKAGFDFSGRGGGGGGGAGEGFAFRAAGGADVNGAVAASGDCAVNIDDLVASINNWKTSDTLRSQSMMGSYYKREGYPVVMLESGEPGVGQRGDASTNATDRAVVRKAQMDLLTENVRAAFLKAQHLVSEANGEYVQDSALVGTEKDQNLQANLTLRVTTEHLSAVLNELRELGKVNAESSGGEDVTATMVDLEARLSNERRVEKELLDLMEKRTDAPLKEVLELRDKISQIRQNIEQMTAQRERLGRLVSLATILVIIRSEPEQPKPATQPAEKTISQYFGESVGNAWNNGLLALADTVAGMLKVLIGGIIWWAALIVGIIALRQHLRRRMMVAATRA